VLSSATASAFGPRQGPQNANRLVSAPCCPAVFQPRRSSRKRRWARQRRQRRANRAQARRRLVSATGVRARHRPPPRWAGAVDGSIHGRSRRLCEKSPFCPPPAGWIRPTRPLCRNRWPGPRPAARRCPAAVQSTRWFRLGGSDADARRQQTFAATVAALKPAAGPWVRAHDRHVPARAKRLRRARATSSPAALPPTPNAAEAGILGRHTSQKGSNALWRCPGHKAVASPSPSAARRGQGRSQPPTSRAEAVPAQGGASASCSSCASVRSAVNLGADEAHPRLLRRAGGRSTACSASRALEARR